MIYHAPEEADNLTKTINISFQSVSISWFDSLKNGIIGLVVPFVVTTIVVLTLPTCFLYRCCKFCKKPSELQVKYEETAKLTHDPSTVSKTNVNIYEYRSSYLFAFNNSINIFWALAIQTSWYLLPVYQFVALSQNYIHTLGNSQYCYYDYICAKPYDFTPLDVHFHSLHNILSNGPYIVLGIFYIILVCILKCNLKRKQKTAILISLGASLMMEGIFNTIYNVCPSTYKFQFDTTFMYTMLSIHISFVLCLNSPDSFTKINKSSYSSSKRLEISKVSVMEWI